MWERKEVQEMLLMINNRKPRPSQKRCLQLMVEGHWYTPERLAHASHHEPLASISLRLTPSAARAALSRLWADEYVEVMLNANNRNEYRRLPEKDWLQL